MMMMGWKCHAKVLPCSYSPRKFTSINYIPSSSFKYNNSNNIQLSSRWLGTPLFSSCPISNTNTYCHTGSNPQEEEEEEVKYENKNDLFATDKFIMIKPKPSVVNSTNLPSLSRMLASLLSYGVVFTFITIAAACLYTPYPALAGSFGRMGGSSSSSFSSWHGSSSSSGPSGSYYNLNYDDDDDDDSRCLMFTCICDSNCTHCNCNIKEKDDIKVEDNDEEAEGNTCSCNCHKSCRFHRQIQSYNPWIAYIYIFGTIIGTIVSAWDGTPAVQPIGTMLCFQVGCSDRERVLQRKLNHIAEVADTSTLNGLNYILKEVVKALIQQNETSFHFSNLFIEYDSMESLSKRFLQIINRERDKYGQDVETFVNVDGVKYKNCMVEANSSNIENEYTLATVSVLATGKHLIPSTNKKRQVYLDTAAVLQTLISIPKTEIQSVEVLWSPQKEDHVLLKEPRMLKEEPGRDHPKLIGLDTKGPMTRIYMQ